MDKNTLPTSRPADDPGQELRILHLEDDPYDVELVQATLMEDGINGDIVHVDNEKDFAAALSEQQLDLILADFALPSFDGLKALQIAQDKSPETPFIFVSGAIGEELAIETLRQGAVDYILKHRLARLGPAVRRALREVFERRERRRAEAALQKAHRELEGRVRERTAELTYTNATLIEQIEERERAEAEIRQRNRELATLNLITAAVSSSLELPEVFATLQELLVQQLEIAGGGLLLYDGSLNQLNLKSSWGVPESALAALQPEQIADSHLAPVVHENQIVLEHDFRAIPAFRERKLDELRPAWRGYLSVPLVAKGGVQGAFCLFSIQSFRDSQVAFFKTLGQQVGVAIQNARLFAEVLNKREQLRQLAQKVVSIQEDERRRVARELHDEAGQALTVLKISLGLIKGSLPEQLVDARQRIDEAVELTGETMESIRLLAHDLRPAELEHVGLNKTLEGLCRDFANRTQLRLAYEGAEFSQLTDSVSICLYRVVQEALTNVAKHARARQVSVLLDSDTGYVRLQIEDDGHGFDVQGRLNTAAKTKGIGLSGMRERIEVLGGQLAIESAPGRGTRLVARVPVEEGESFAGPLSAGSQQRRHA